MVKTTCGVLLRRLAAVCSIWTVAVTTVAADTPRRQEGWVLRADDYNAPYVGTSMANGNFGVLPWKEPFSIRQVVLNHVFELNDKTHVNCAIKAVNPFSLQMEVDGKAVDGASLSAWKQEVNMRDSEHTTSFTVDGKVNVEYDVVALRNLPYAGLIRVRLTALKEVSAAFRATVEVPEEECRAVRHLHRAIKVKGNPADVLRADTETKYGRYNVCAGSLFVRDEAHTSLSMNDSISTLSLTLKKGETAEFSLVGSICTTKDFSDPYTEVERQLIYIRHEGVEKVLAGHRRLWHELWQGDIEIEGDLEAQQAVRLALYNLYSFAREGSRLSIPPMGLSSQGYNGHIFWDTELWMYPPMLLLQPGIARSMVDYRVDRMDAARTRASAFGYQGLMYPWESDFWGQECTPSWALTGQFEHHVTMDVSIAAWNYYCATQDRRWLADEGWPLIKGVAEFVKSRVEKNEDGSYSINGVVGADEYAIHVDDNAFTNASAIVALRNAVKAAALVGEKADAAWTEIADRLRILQDENGVTMNYAGYAGQLIKQADVNLLGFPLGLITDRDRLLKDLAYYEGRVDPKKGPAMTFSAFCVQYARLGERAKAEETFRRCYRPNLRPPFGVLAETPTSQNPYFATGAGGLLQAVLFGFGGLEVTEQGIVQRETLLPASWRRLTIKGVGRERKTFECVAK